MAAPLAGNACHLTQTRAGKKHGAGGKPLYIVATWLFSVGIHAAFLLWSAFYAVGYCKPDIFAGVVRVAFSPPPANSPKDQDTFPLQYEEPPLETIRIDESAEENYSVDESCELAELSASEARLDNVPAPPVVLSGSNRAETIGVDPVPDNPPPEYPLTARRMGWSGDTLLLVTVNGTGEVIGIEVSATSGREVLDASAMEAVRKWRFRVSGPIIEARLYVRIRFILESR